ncbi:MAG TPA: CapA family protein, partial [Dehalococcoidia bacterium]|nr:CapA family protein [Dehalococcoidia bacterium]
MLRRAVMTLAALLALAAVALATHREPLPDGVRTADVGTATPQASDGAAAVVQVAVPEGLHDRIAGVIAGAGLEEQPGKLSLVPAGAPADVRVEPAVSSDTDAPVARRWVVVASPARLDLDGVSRAEIDAIAAGGRLYVAEEHAALVAPLFLPGRGPRAVAAASIPGLLAAEPDALAIVPGDTVDTRVRALAFDGIDPVRGAGMLDAYPLVTRVRVRASGDAAEHRALAAALQAALARPDPPPLRVLFTGDLIPSRCVYDQIRRANDWAAPFRQVAAVLREADLTVGSLDASLSDKGAPIGCRETFNLLTDPRVVQGFTLAGYDVMTVAANHAKDCGGAGYCGDAAFLDTIAVLRAAGIAPAGGGKTLAEARRPAIVTAGGVRFAFLGYDDIAPYYHADAVTPGTAPLDLSTLADDVRAARDVADVVVVLPHWGVEYTADPTPRQQEAARVAVEAGAALVVGNHPHVVQAAAPLGDGYAAWALGNFVFDQ